MHHPARPITSDRQAARGYSFALLCLAVATTPYSTPLILELRLNDILLLISLFLSVTFMRVGRGHLLMLFTFLGLFVATSLASRFADLNFAPERIGFLYKYLILFLIPALTWACLNKARRLYLLLYILFFVFMFLTFWVYYYKFAVSSGAIYGVSRVSYPGAESFLVSDAHLYSNYLSMMLIGYFFWMRKALHHSMLTGIMITIVTLGALFLTGSRNGLLALATAALVYSLLWLLFSKRKLSWKVFWAGALSALAAGAAVFFFRNQIISFLGDLFFRATDFSLGSDASSISRILKFQIALNDLERGSYVFGASPFGASLVWYDGGISIILAHFGFAGLLFVILALRHVLSRIARLASLQAPAGRAALTLCVAYVVSNLVTEFALVTRSALPTIVMICLIVRSECLAGASQNPRLGSSSMRKHGARQLARTGSGQGS